MGETLLEKLETAKKTKHDSKTYHQATHNAKYLLARGLLIALRLQQKSVNFVNGRGSFLFWKGMAHRADLKLRNLAVADPLQEWEKFLKPKGRSQIEAKCVVFSNVFGVEQKQSQPGKCNLCLQQNNVLELPKRPNGLSLSNRFYSRDGPKKGLSKGANRNISSGPRRKVSIPQ